MGLIYRAEELVSALRRLRETRAHGPLGAFHRAGGASLLVSNLPVTSEDLVVDGGGYVGEWTDAMLCRYGCRMIVFEALPRYADALSDRYRSNSRVEIRRVALAGRAGQAAIAIDGESSSLFGAARAREAEIVELLDCADFVLAQDWMDLGCMMLNIEGAEYEVLERLLSADLMKRFRCLLIQFHRNAPNAETRRRAIQRELDQTHVKVFDFPFIWERWDRRMA